MDKGFDEGGDQQIGECFDDSSNTENHSVQNRDEIDNLSTENLNKNSGDDLVNIFSDESVNEINNKLERKGYKLERIDDIKLNGLEDNFWQNSGKGGGGRNEETWKQVMQPYPEILNRLKQGQSLDDIWDDDRLKPTCSTLFNDRQRLRIDRSDPKNMVIDGRHRIAMGQKLGFTHLPMKMEE